MFKKTKRGFQFDPKGNLRIPTKPDLFNDEAPPMRNQHGWPMKNYDDVDWDQLNKELEERERRNGG